MAEVDWAELGGIPELGEAVAEAKDALLADTAPWYVGPILAALEMIVTEIEATRHAVSPAMLAEIEESDKRLREQLYGS